MTALTDGRCVHQARETVTMTRLQVTEENGTVTRRTVPDHRLEGNLEVWIDFKQLIWLLGDKALRSHGKRAQLGQGAIVVKATDLRKLPL